MDKVGLLPQYNKSKEVQDGFEKIACEICGQSNGDIVVERSDLLLGGAEVYQMIQCQECKCFYLNPRPTTLKMAEFYPQDYQPYTVGLHTERFLNRFFRRYGLQKRLRIITKYVAQGKLLDVGCATGDFLAEVAIQDKWDVLGVETNLSAAKYAKEQIGLDILVSTLNDSPFSDESFDVVTMWDVLEHVYDPCAVLDEVARLLRPGGVFVVNHPNLDSLDRLLFGRFWAGFELPRHLYLFPTKLLEELMFQRGFHQIERLCLYGSHAGTSTSLKFFFQNSAGASWLGETFIRLVLSKAFRILLVPYFKIIDILKIGSNVTVVFQKNKPESK